MIYRNVFFYGFIEFFQKIQFIGWHFKSNDLFTLKKFSEIYLFLKIYCYIKIITLNKLYLLLSLLKKLYYYVTPDPKYHWFYTSAWFLKNTLHLILKFHWPYTRHDRQTLHGLDCNCKSFATLRTININCFFFCWV